MCELTYLTEEKGQVSIKQEYLDKLAELKQEKERVEKELKTLSSGITKELETRYNETTKLGNYNFVAKGGFYSFAFDEELFKQEHLELYIEYLKPVEVKTTYTLVSATREKKQ